MFEAHIDGSVRIGDQAALSAIFKTDTIFLANGTLELTGTVRVGPGVTFAGVCRMGDDVEIENGAMLTNVVLGAANRVRAYSVITDVEAGARNLFGPFCFIRGGCAVGDDCILGAHVEATRTRFASGVKVSHRAFIGDAEVGARTIVGCGVVFCNWDGSGRQATTVGADVTLGSGTLLIPPLRVGDRAVIAAGSVITHDVAAGTRVIQKRAGAS